ncbi:DUF2326 domain-containing protein (plasmid) [Paracoccus sp. Arc7-R13]|uniref:DUF2326 domain-containing protein n=1 Tax=Paracoccus sp. Arc7-R13 TaxID=2500532 RepID=UPI000FD8D714|nr:DUF2326 domain-containing protein [Paracoccus sp. Arc7-R13]AZY95547.1 DUF2326 domain-containing protein [Paracoccus sp. Arc7-R13]
MIVEITSTLTTFKPLRFKRGLNILVAERHETSGAKETRNGTGKTSFIELVHYLLTEKRNVDGDFHKPEIIGSEFCGKFARSGSEFVICKKSNPKTDELKRDGEVITPRNLRKELALEWFSLSEEDSAQTYSPKFGALLAYFVRKERNGGFASPKMNSSSQQDWDSQVSLSYLLGFDWRLPQKLQVKKDEKKDADTLAKMIKSGYLTDGALDVNKMQARLDLLDTEIDGKRKEVAAASVVDGYRQHEVTANQLTGRIRDLNEANLEDLDLLESIDAALKEVDDASAADLKSVYEQVGIFFSDQIKKRFEQVEAFHRQVAKNRELHLKRERRNASERLSFRKTEIIRLQDGLKDKLDLLKSGIAIERLTLLQSDLNRLEAEQADLRTQIPRFRDVEEERKRLGREIADLVDLIGQDVIEREVARKTAVQIFGETSKFLYDEPGQLVLGKSKGIAGLSIETDIVGKKSGGKNHMQVFCFDWLLVEVAKKNDRFPGFLIHDSHIFDGVDGRQIGLALSLAQKKCESLGVQYIVAMNSDDLQKIKNEEEVSGEEIFDPSDYIMDTRLSDEPNGGLFGVRF